MTQYIRFTKTTKKDITVGKFYEVKTVGPDGGYYFDDDAGDERYVRRRGKLNYFEVFSEADFPINDMSEDEVDDVLTAIERLQEQGQSFDMDDEEGEELRYIVFSDTDKDDVTLGKPYIITKSDIGGYVFYDDADDMRYAANNDAGSAFEIVDENGDPWLDAYERSVKEAEAFIAANSPQPDPDGVVCIDFIDGYVAHFHDVDSFDIEERVGITLVIITDVEGGKTLIPFDRVRKMRLLHLHDGVDE